MSFRNKQYQILEKEHTKDIIKLYLQGKEMQEIALLYLKDAHNYRPIREILVKNNIHIRTRSEVKQLTDEKNMGKLGNNGRRYLYKNDYFKKWSSNMAYLVGFIVADGCIKRDRELCISLQRQDRYLLELFASELSVQKNVQLVKDEINHIKGINKEYYSSQLKIVNKIMIQDLKSLGIMENKSLVISEVKDLPQEYIPDFIRGVFDGDGNISLSYVQTKTKGEQIYLRWRLISGSKKLLEFIQEQLKTLKVPYKKIYCTNKKDGKTIYTLEYSGKNAEQIFELMYQNNPQLYLKRKKEKFDVYKEHYNKNNN